MTCSICWWEADGEVQSEDEPRGANHNYTLRRARENFIDHGHMYDLGSEISYLKSESDERRALLEYARSAQSGEVELSQDALNRLIKAADNHMRAEADKARVSDTDEEEMLRVLMEGSPRQT